MSDFVPRNRVRRGHYVDSVTLMRLSRAAEAMDGVQRAALMIGSAANRELLRAAGLLTGDGMAAGPNDVIVAVLARDRESGEAALQAAMALLEAPAMARSGAGPWQPRSLAAASEGLAGANLALISVPGAFAAEEAWKALRRDLNVLLFSDNVPLADERALKVEADRCGLLVMGPDCGTAFIAGTPLGFANAVALGGIGIVAASGTGLQEVATLIDRHGGGLSHGIGVGGRDLDAAIGGIATLAAIAALDRDPGTMRGMLIAKPSAPAVVQRVVERLARSPKPWTFCCIGSDPWPMPAHVRQATTLVAAAEDALGGIAIGTDFDMALEAMALAARLDTDRRRIRGLYAGGTLAAEARLIIDADGGPDASRHRLTDLGDDAFTLGRPHPMLDPWVRRQPMGEALGDPTTAVLLLDVILGYGSPDDPVAPILDAVAGADSSRPVVIASVCGTERDPQVRSVQVARLAAAGVTVAPSNAHAANLAVRVVSGRAA
ncbi:MAG: oxidoreductase [Alphaproteobacteria bacterium]|nr:oxidoreductase [Alphaproteobacteria bacterium]